MNKATFSVDAALLRELGERLIGRAHIALAELVKNAYDADAIDCHIRFEDDRIVVADDGHGMSGSEFLEHWMRIGTAHKAELGVSRTLNRALTGSKGIGRLSAQFLASEMTLESTSADRPGETLYAIIDWTKIEHGRNLDTVEVVWEHRAKAPKYPNRWTSGTRIELRGLKAEWDAGALEELGREVWVLRSPFESHRRSPGARGAMDFRVEIDAPGIEGARKSFDTMRANLFDNWKARIEGRLRRGRRGDEASVSLEFRPGYPGGMKTGNVFSETVALPIKAEDSSDISLVDSAEFKIFIFKPEGRQPGGVSVRDMRDYLGRFGNVSVYDAGFRLPYYGAGGDKTGQDWLNIAVDQGRRLNASELLPERLRTQTRYMQDLPAPGRLFGAVHIDTGRERAVARKTGASSGERLRIQSSRDRLQANSAFFQLRDLVRFSLDLYANRYRSLSLQAVEKERGREPASRKFDRALQALDRGKADMPAAVYRETKREIAGARKASATEEEALDRRAVLLAPLATAGMTALAMSHEMARDSRFLANAGEKLSRLAKRLSVSELDDLAREFDDMRRRLDALQELFAPLLSETDRAATERLRVRPVIHQAMRSMRPLLPRVEFDLSGIDRSLRFPAGSFAEWNAVLQNIVANAWNAMLDSGRMDISFDGGRGGGGREWLWMSDTGQGLGMDPEDSETLFEPFERRLDIDPDNRSIAIGGQGLGLTIVRMIARRRRADVRFVEPPEGFSTTFEMAWRGVNP